APDQLLVLDQGDVGLDAGGVAVHHEADRAGGRDYGRLGVAVAIEITQLAGLVPRIPRRAQQGQRDMRRVDVVDGAAVLVHDAQHRLAVDREAAEGTLLLRGAGRLSG